MRMTNRIDFGSRMVGLCLILGMVTVTVPAQAAVSVIGDGQARECWMFVVTGSQSSRALDACNGALSNEVLQRKDRAATLVNRGIVFLRDRKLSQAKSDFDSALRLIPTLGEAHINRGATLLLMEKPKEALADLNRGIELGTSEPWSGYYNRAFAHEVLGDAAAAYDDFTQAAALKPDWQAPLDELMRFTVTPVSTPTNSGR